MAFIADILLAAGALGAAFYCFVLGRRLRRFNDLETGVGGAVALLSQQVEELKGSLDEARRSATGSTTRLEELTQRAETVRAQLELQLAALHDLEPAHPSQTEPEAAQAPAPTPAATDDPAEPLFTRHRRKAS